MFLWQYMLTLYVFFPSRKNSFNFSKPNFHYSLILIDQTFWNKHFSLNFLSKCLKQKNRPIFVTQLRNWQCHQKKRKRKRRRRRRRRRRKKDEEEDEEENYGNNKLRYSLNKPITDPRNLRTCQKTTQPAGK